MPRCDTAAMSLHLAEISTAVAANAHAVVLLDQAGWHAANDLVIPDNITLTQLLHFALFRRRKGAGMLGFSRALSLCGAK